MVHQTAAHWDKALWGMANEGTAHWGLSCWGMVHWIMVHWGIAPQSVDHWGTAHRSMDHGGMAHWSMDCWVMDHRNMDHWGIAHQSMDHWGMAHWSMDHWGIAHQSMDQWGIGHQSMDHCIMAHWSMDHWGIAHQSMDQWGIGHQSMDHCIMSHQSTDHWGMAHRSRDHWGHQNRDHWSMDHWSMAHQNMDHWGIAYKSMDHRGMAHRSIDHWGTAHQSMYWGTAHQSMDHWGMAHTSMDHWNMAHRSMDHWGIAHKAWMKKSWPRDMAIEKDAAKNEWPSLYSNLLHSQTRLNPDQNQHLGLLKKKKKSLPSTSLVNSFSDEVSRECVLKVLLVGEGVVALRVRHAARLEPAVKDLCHTVQDPLASRRGDGQVVDAEKQIKTRWNHGLSKGIMTILTSYTNKIAKIGPKRIMIYKHTQNIKVLFSFLHDSFLSFKLTLTHTWFSLFLFLLLSYQVNTIPWQMTHKYSKLGRKYWLFPV